MTQDCLNSPSTADVSKRLPKGIHVIGAERLSDPSVEGISPRKRIRKKEDPSTNPTSWSYIFILHMAAKGMEKWLEKFNAEISLSNYRLVIAATNDKAINQAVFEACENLNILVNSVDDPPHCRFMVPAIIDRSPLVVSVATNGASAG